MITNAEHSGRDDALGLLLAGNEKADGMDAARRLLQEDPSLREEFESLQRFGLAIEEVGDALHARAGLVDLRDDVLDSVAHLAFEELGVANASPYAEVERGLKELKQRFDARAGQVSLVEDVMAAIAASRKTDTEVERPFAGVAMALNSLAAAANASAPEVDLVEPVMEKIARPTNITPLRARPAVAEARPVPSRRGIWTVYVGWAAAAALCAGAGWLYTVLNSGAPALRVAGNKPGTGETSLQPDNGLARVKPYPEGGLEWTPDTAPVTPGGESKSGIKEPLTLQDAINASRRKSLAQDNNFDLLASLTNEEARKLISSGDLSLEALLGTTQYLSDEEAVAALRAALAEHPDDPYLKFALALKLEGDPEAAEERLQYLSELAADETNNSLPNYMLASDYFERGEMALALDALSKGAAYNSASAYALEGARQREAAFIASGLGQDEARFLALATAGESEYEDILSLRNQLLEYGAEYEEQGDYDTAKQIYNAVDQLGEQLYEGAALAVEQQYGLETRHDAISAIQDIAEIFQQPETVALLGETLGILAGGIVEVTEYMTASQELVINTNTANQLNWSAFLQHVMTSGDLNVAGFVR